MSSLEAVDLCKSFLGGKLIAVQDLSLSVAPGEIVSILGPSGCGKTTAMRMLAGLEHPDSGEIRVCGSPATNLPPHRRDVGLVFQDLALFPHLTVFENVAFGLRMKRVPKAAWRDRVDAALRMVNLPPQQFADRYPQQLSGGQRQRVAVARTVVVEPAVVLFDEPMAALDRLLRDHMAVELRQIQKRLGLAAVYVTHDQETAMLMSDRIAIMERGRLIQIGSPEEIYARPASQFAASFLGSMNFITAEVRGADAEHLDIQVRESIVRLPKPHHPVASSVTLGLRPERLELRPPRDRRGFAEGTVESQQFVGGEYLYNIAVAGEIFLAKSRRPFEGAAAGTPVRIDADPTSFVIIPASA